MAMQGLNAVSAVGSSVNQAQAGVAAAGVERKFANYNASQAEEAASDALNRGKTEALQIGGRAERLKASQSVATGGMEIDPNFGTAGALQAETDAAALQDRITAGNNAIREAYGLRKDASMMRYRGTAGLNAARSQAVSTIATGGLQAAQDVMRGAYLYETYKKPPSGSGADIYVRPPGGKSMSDPRYR